MELFTMLLITACLLEKDGRAASAAAQAHVRYSELDKKAEDRLKVYRRRHLPNVDPAAIAVSAWVVKSVIDQEITLTWRF